MTSSPEQIREILQGDRFCAHLTLSATIYPGSRWVPCCKASGEYLHSAPISQMDIQQFKQTDNFQQIRNDLEQGRHNNFCESCWSVEKSGGQSDRQSNNENWLRIIQENNLWSDFDRVYQQNQTTAWHWYLFFDNQCQARCVMCDPTFSSALAKEYRSIGWDTIQYAKDRSATATSNDPEMVFETFKSYAHEAKILQILGGEPTLSNQCLVLLHWLVDAGLSSNIILKINTNGINIGKPWLEVAKRFKSCQWSVSVDALGELNRWIRYPTVWATLESNIDQLAHEGYFVLIKTAVHALNVHFLPELYDWTRRKGLLMNTTIVRDPDEISILALTQAQRQALQKKYHGRGDFVLDHGEKILQYLASEPAADPHDLISFVQELEPRRPCQFAQVNEFFSQRFFSAD